jgi:hypothetical protein
MQDLTGSRAGDCWGRASCIFSATGREDASARSGPFLPTNALPPHDLHTSLASGDHAPHPLHCFMNFLSSSVSSSQDQVTRGSISFFLSGMLRETTGRIFVSGRLNQFGYQPPAETCHSPVISLLGKPEREGYGIQRPGLVFRPMGPVSLND